MSYPEYFISYLDLSMCLLSLERAPIVPLCAINKVLFYSKLLYRQCIHYYTITNEWVNTVCAEPHYFLLSLRHIHSGSFSSLRADIPPAWGLTLMKTSQLAGLPAAPSFYFLSWGSVSLTPQMPSEQPRRGVLHQYSLCVLGHHGVRSSNEPEDLGIT